MYKFLILNKIQAVKASRESGIKYKNFEKQLVIYKHYSFRGAATANMQGLLRIGCYNKNTINANFLKTTKLMMVSKT
jgi:hypothetical protein